MADRFFSGRRKTPPPPSPFDFEDAAITRRMSRRLSSAYGQVPRMSSPFIARGRTSPCPSRRSRYDEPLPQIVSPYDAAVERTKNNKLFSNKVHAAWYRRYKPALHHTYSDPKLAMEDMLTEFQPADEIDRREEDIALQHYFGENFRMFACHTRDPSCMLERAITLRRYRRMKEIEQKRKDDADKGQDNVARVLSLRSIIAANKTKPADFQEIFGYTNQEKKLVVPVVEYMQRLVLLKRRLIFSKAVKCTSKWRKVKRPENWRLIMNKHAEIIKGERRARFHRIIKLVVCVQRFLSVIALIAGDTMQFMKGVKTFQETLARQGVTKSTRAPGQGGKLVFDPSKYKFTSQNALSMPMIMILTKPWFKRSEADVSEVMRGLSKMRSFVQYPVFFQRLIAKVAWFVEVPEKRVVIRQGQCAVEFYFMLCGKAKMEKLVGDPYYQRRSRFRVIKYLKSQDTFGEECIARPNSLREYTVTTEVDCQLLSINVHDFYEMIMETKDDEEAPEHIRFISHLQFLDNFPKLQLVTEPENITLFYYTDGVLVAQELAKSEYVYVVYTGKCNVLVEVLPPQEDQAKYRARQQQIKRSLLPERKQKISSSAQIIEISSEQDNKRPPRTRVSKFEKISQTSIDVSKHMEAIRRNKKIYHALVEEVDRRIAATNEQRENIMEETREISARNKRLLSNMKQLQTEKSSLSSLTSDKKSEVFGSGDDLRPTGSVASTTRKTSGPDIEESQSRRSTIIFVTPEAEETVASTSESGARTRADRKRSSVIGSQISFREAAFSVLEPHSRPTSLSQPRFSVIKRQSIKEEAEGPSSGEEEQEEELKEPEQTQEDGMSKNGEQRRDSSDSFLSLSDTQLKSIQGSNKALLPDEKITTSQWKLEKILHRGDTVGVEWLDYNDGPFEPPQGKWSLVSKGATVIMVRRDFLLRYLRKIW